MTAYSVYLPQGGTARGQAGNFRLVADARAPMALIAPPLWLVWHRLWLALLAYGVAILLFLLLYQLTSHFLVLYATALPAFYLFLEGNRLIENRLSRAGWEYAGTFEGETAEDAEIRYLLSAIPGPGSSPRQKPAGPEMRSLSPAANTGLFPE